MEACVLLIAAASFPKLLLPQAWAVWQFHCDHKGWRPLTSRNWGITKRQGSGGAKLVPRCWVYRLGTELIHVFQCDFILLPGRAKAMCSITGIVSLGPLGDTAWDWSLDWRAWRQGITEGQVLQAHAAWRPELPTVSCPTAMAKWPAAQTLRIIPRQLHKPNVACPFLPCAIKT